MNFLSKETLRSAANYSDIVSNLLSKEYLAKLKELRDFVRKRKTTLKGFVSLAAFKGFLEEALNFLESDQQEEKLNILFDRNYKIFEKSLLDQFMFEVNYQMYQTRVLDFSLVKFESNRIFFYNLLTSTYFIDCIDNTEVLFSDTDSMMEKSQEILCNLLPFYVRKIERMFPDKLTVLTRRLLKIFHQEANLRNQSFLEREQKYLQEAKVSLNLETFFGVNKSNNLLDFFNQLDLDILDFLDGGYRHKNKKFVNDFQPKKITLKENTKLDTSKPSNLLKKRILLSQIDQFKSIQFSEFGMIGSGVSSADFLDSVTVPKTESNKVEDLIIQHIELDTELALRANTKKLLLTFYKKLRRVMKREFQTFEDNMKSYFEDTIEGMCDKHVVLREKLKKVLTLAELQQKEIAFYTKENKYMKKELRQLRKKDVQTTTKLMEACNKNFLLKKRSKDFQLINQRLEERLIKQTKVNESLQNQQKVFRKKSLQKFTKAIDKQNKQFDKLDKNLQDQLAQLLNRISQKDRSLDSLIKQVHQTNESIREKYEQDKKENGQIIQNIQSSFETITSKTVEAFNVQTRDFEENFRTNYNDRTELKSRVVELESRVVELENEISLLQKDKQRELDNIREIYELKLSKLESTLYDDAK